VSQLDISRFGSTIQEMNFISSVPDIQQAIDYFSSGHRKMQETIARLSEKQMTKELVLDDWTVKDILAHLAAWSGEAVAEIDRILNNKATWHILYPTDEDTSKFNEPEVVKRRSRTLQEVINEWETNFEAEMKRISELTAEQWERQSGNDVWPEEGNPVTPSSLYGYEYNGEQHEAGHASQINKHFNLGT